MTGVQLRSRSVSYSVQGCLLARAASSHPSTLCRDLSRLPGRIPPLEKGCGLPKATPVTGWLPDTLAVSG